MAIIQNYSLEFHIFGFLINLFIFIYVYLQRDCINLANETIADTLFPKQIDIFVTLGPFIYAECCPLFHLWGGKFDAVIRTMHKKCQFRIATKQGSRQIALGRGGYK